MVNSRTIQVRLTGEQYERIKANTQAKGFNSLSAFVRYVALNQEFQLHQRITEIHRHLLGPLPGPKPRKNSPHVPFL